MIANTSRPKPIAESRKPATSCPASDRPFVFGTSFNANTKSSTPIGTLTQKIHRQPAYSVSRPPASGPTAAAPAMTAPHTPKAAARSSPWNREFTLDRVEGRIAAPPTPWTTRATISTPADPARPHAKTPSAAHLFGACARAESAAAGALCVPTAPRFSLIFPQPMDCPRRAHQPKG